MFDDGIWQKPYLYICGPRIKGFKGHFCKNWLIWLHLAILGTWPRVESLVADCFLGIWMKSKLLSTVDSHCYNSALHSIYLDSKSWGIGIALQWASCSHISICTSGNLLYIDSTIYSLSFLCNIAVCGATAVTFEDKRKANFDKGQAELDRRRALLKEQQEKEEEERRQKEREEQEKRERKRLENFTVIF